MSSWAWAAGRVQWTNTTVKEQAGSSGSWKLDIKIFLPKAPDVAHVPVKFEFSPIAYYERAMMDGDKLVVRRVPLVGRQDLIESVDLGFMDPGTGKIENRTRFTFKVTRAHGFEAGEYKVVIRDTRNGQPVGAPTTLKLEGENEIIDRRAMVFADKKKPPKKEEPKPDGEGGEGGEASGEPETEPEPEPEPEPTPQNDPPQTIDEKPGGCGCRAAGERGGSPASGAALLLGLAALWRRRFSARR
ncbi:MAG: hypothetical protein KF718_01460 [Polyangiaceae bacterium]|nr:hypothetical protein [Polyangiaceae bacterium]